MWLINEHLTYGSSFFVEPLPDKSADVLATCGRLHQSIIGTCTVFKCQAFTDESDCRLLNAIS